MCQHICASLIWTTSKLICTTVTGTTSSYVDVLLKKHCIVGGEENVLGEHLISQRELANNIVEEATYVIEGPDSDQDGASDSGGSEGVDHDDDDDNDDHMEDHDDDDGGE